MEPIKTPSARYAFTAVRDEAGVPHVEAESWQEALYALGYLHATDRPTQIVFARTVASGRAAERIANTPEFVETDIFFRRAGLFQQLDREVALLPESTRSDVAFYCAGVNDGLTDAGRSLPMWVTGFRPKPWDVQAVLLIGNLLSFAGLAVGQQENERLLLELVQLGIDEDRLRELFDPHLDGIDFGLLREIRMESRLSDEALELLADLPRLAGSNAWAVGPGRSGSGNALFASDPHLEVNRLPAIWYEVVLEWKEANATKSRPQHLKVPALTPSPKDRGARSGINSKTDPCFVMGATLPGCPLISVGRTRHVAWGVTYMHGDTSDHFIEECRQGGATGWQYRRGEEWNDFTLREETIERKGDKPHTLRLYASGQGTIEGDPDVTGPGKYISAAWIGHEEGAGKAIGNWIDLVHAQTAEDAMNIARECPHPSLVWVFADRDGHIGLQASGWFPRRSEIHSGIVPVPAWDVRNHWHGRIDSRALPRLLDPPNGFVATANESVNPQSGLRFTTHPLPDYRKRRIDEELARLSGATVEDMQRLQYDVLSTQARELLPTFLVHMPESELKDRLTAWDFRYTPDSCEATAFQSLYRNVVSEVFGHEAGVGWRRLLYLATRLGYSTMLLTCVDRTLKRDRSAWWPERDKGDLVRRAAAQTAADPIVPWSKANAFQFVNRFIHGGRAGRLLGFRSAQIPLAGNHATPFQGHLLTTAMRQSTFAPSYHFVADLGTAEALTNLPGGPSESRFSKWYKTDVARWIGGEYKRLAAIEWNDARDEDHE